MNPIVKALTPLVALLAALGLADWAGWLESALIMVPAWTQAASLVITAAAAVAALLPSQRAAKNIKRLKNFLNGLGFNFGAAKNKEDDE